MSLAVQDDHLALQNVIRQFVRKNDPVVAVRRSLDGDTGAGADMWEQISQLGWLSLHGPEEVGGGGFGLTELALVLFELGSAMVPGPLLPTAAASAVLSRVDRPPSVTGLITDLLHGVKRAGIGIDASLRIADGRISGDAGVVLGAPGADVLVLGSDSHLIVVDAGLPGVVINEPEALDRSRRTGRVLLADVEVASSAILRQSGSDTQRIVWTLAAAEAAGIAHSCTQLATEYAKVREQFGRPIGSFQAVKHHCANMLVRSELATAAVWGAANAGDHRTDDEFDLAAAVAARLALSAAVTNAHLNIQVHGGIGFTWEHDAHLYLRRALSLHALFAGTRQDETIIDNRRREIVVRAFLDLGPDEGQIRRKVSSFVQQAAGQPETARQALLASEGYLMPHWPRPYGLSASPAEQIIIEEEFDRAGIVPLQLGITGWNVATIIEHGTEVQRQRWVNDALAGTVWCQLFSEPDAGSDAAAVRTRAVRTDGGWRVSGQKIWSSQAHLARWGLATVRTDPDVPKHLGITTMVIDMESDEVEVRPLRQITGSSEFNEVFLNDVFVPDDQVVGPVNGGWAVARSTLSNERVTIGGFDRFSGVDLVGIYDAAGAPPGTMGAVAEILATSQAARLVDLRRAQKAISGSELGPEGNITKLVQAELGHAYAQVTLDLLGAESVFEEGPGAVAAALNLNGRRTSIAGGTSEITRNQIAERLLGLPRS
ncbi:MAG: acyl-CoA dehydrogenase [Actinomycetota bacterium]|nr:acyl-CoA dehydrogenase [Actinomycetota bacterium]